MKKSTLRVAAALAAVVLVVVGAAAWRFFAERHAVGQLLATGASVAFDSDLWDREVFAHHRVHSTDERDPIGLMYRHWTGAPSPWDPSSADPATGKAPWGFVRLVSLVNDESVNALLNYQNAFDKVEELWLDKGVTDAAAARLFAAINSGVFDVRGCRCYATLARQSTLDSLLTIRLRTLFLGPHSIEGVDLSRFAESSIEGLWLLDWDEAADAPAANGYDAECFASIAANPRLRSLCVRGVSITGRMAEALASASQLQWLRLDQCPIATDAHRVIDTQLDPQVDFAMKAVDESDLE
ncbi:hypothetical protein [Botrimarina sp.]|uniref:hypothetical protein n=1 Tax=Botrimarina sp. TaxID=2795802 RepID=UPI0032EB3465